jgi:F0F1-type ATP synthase assembly protein I
VSTLISGIVLWGAVGLGLDHLFGTGPVLFVVGAILGNFGGIYLMYVRYLRESAEPDERPVVGAVAGWPSRPKPEGSRHAS